MNIHLSINATVREIEIIPSDTLLTFLRQLAYTSIQRYGGLFAPFFGNICRKLFSSLRFALKGHYGMDKTW